MTSVSENEGDLCVAGIVLKAHPSPETCRHTLG